MYTVEIGIGYSGVFAPFRVFESRAWEHYLAGRDGLDHRQYDVVIPNCYDPAEFPLGEGKGGFHLFAGRFIGRKGIQVAVQATKALGVELVMIGPGLIDHSGNTFRGLDSTIEGDHIRHLGPVGPVDRARLMGEAAVVWGPTLYAEPWGGAGCAEPNFCGTPVVTSDFGAFTELVENGVNGYRARVLSDFIKYGRMAEGLDRTAIREYATRHWSTEVGAELYARLFRQLQRLDGLGWADLDEKAELIQSAPPTTLPASGDASGRCRSGSKARGSRARPSLHAVGE
jgi:glycosyltransferase involved in cell wall biosynthesis